MDRLAELDSASEDVLVGVVRALEEQLWMTAPSCPRKERRSPRGSEGVRE